MFGEDNTNPPEKWGKNLLTAAGENYLFTLQDVLFLSEFFTERCAIEKTRIQKKNTLVNLLHLHMWDENCQGKDERSL